MDANETKYSSTLQQQKPSPPPPISTSPVNTLRKSEEADINLMKGMREMLMKGTVFRKHSEYSEPNKRKVWVEFDDEYDGFIKWCKLGTPSSTSSVEKNDKIRLSTITQVSEGFVETDDIMKFNENVDSGMCISICTPSRSLNFESSSVEVSKIWCMSLKYIVHAAKHKSTTISPVHYVAKLRLNDDTENESGGDLRIDKFNELKNKIKSPKSNIPMCIQVYNTRLAEERIKHGNELKTKIQKYHETIKKQSEKHKTVLAISEEHKNNVEIMKAKYNEAVNNIKTVSEKHKNILEQHQNEIKMLKDQHLEAILRTKDESYKSQDHIKTALTNEMHQTNLQMKTLEGKHKLAVYNATQNATLHEQAEQALQNAKMSHLEKMNKKHDEIKYLKEKMQLLKEEHDGKEEECAREINEHMVQLEATRAEVTHHQQNAKKHEISRQIALQREYGAKLRYMKNAELEAKEIKREAKQRLDQLRDTHASLLGAALNEQKDSHTSELNKVKEMHNAALDEQLVAAEYIKGLKGTHASELDELKGTHASELVKLKAIHASEFNQLKFSHALLLGEEATSLDNLKATHASEINVLKLTHSSSISDKLKEAEGLRNIIQLHSEEKHQLVQKANEHKATAKSKEDALEELQEALKVAKSSHIEAMETATQESRKLAAIKAQHKMEKLKLEHSHDIHLTDRVKSMEAVVANVNQENIRLEHAAAIAKVLHEASQKDKNREHEDVQRNMQREHEVVQKNMQREHEAIQKNMQQEHEAAQIDIQQEAENNLALAKEKYQEEIEAVIQDSENRVRKIRTEENSLAVASRKKNENVQKSLKVSEPSANSKIKSTENVHQALKAMKETHAKHVEIMRTVEAKYKSAEDKFDQELLTLKLQHEKEMHSMIQSIHKFQSGKKTTSVLSKILSWVGNDSELNSELDQNSNQHDEINNTETKISTNNVDRKTKKTKQNIEIKKTKKNIEEDNDDEGIKHVQHHFGPNRKPGDTVIVKLTDGSNIEYKIPESTMIQNTVFLTIKKNQFIESDELEEISVRKPKMVEPERPVRETKL